MAIIASLAAAWVFVSFWPPLVRATRAAEPAPFMSVLWYVDSAVKPGALASDAAEASERFTLDEAIALALDANRLVKNRERLAFIRESVAQAYAGALRAQRALEAADDTLRARREREFSDWARQLNHLMGRDPDARLRVSPQPGAIPAPAGDETVAPSDPAPAVACIEGTAR